MGIDDTFVVELAWEKSSTVLPGGCGVIPWPLLIVVANCGEDWLAR